jgi:hypothetical protein
MSPCVFLGIGTGRCGTVSLARIIGGCRNTHVTHENPATRSPWERPDETALQAFIEHASWGLREGLCIGDVALYWLPHIDRIKDAFPDLRVICLRRDRTATVKSFERKCPGYTLVRPEDRPHQPEWWDLLPTIHAPTITSAWERYYDFYYEQAARIPGALHVELETLDDDRTVTRIFDHLEIPPADRVYTVDRHHNSAAETVITGSRLRSA